MKKFYFLMLAMIVSFAAQAWTVKFTNPNGWANVNYWVWNDAGNLCVNGWPGDAMTQGADGVWFAEADTDMPTKIIFNNGSAQTKDLNFVDGATYDMDGVLGAVITYAKIYIPYSEYPYEVANLHTWNPSITGGWPGLALSKVTVEGVDFWMGEVNAEDVPCTVGGWLLHGEGDDNKTADLPAAQFAADCVTTLAGTCTPIADYVGGDVPPTPSGKSYMLRGQIFGDEDWADYAMTETDGVWTVSGTAVPGAFGIKEVENFAQVGWWWSPVGATISEDGSYAIALQSEAAEGANFTSTLSGDVTFTFNPVAGTLTVKGGEVIPVDYTSWYLNVVGGFNNWEDNGVAFSAEGVATLTALPIGATEFKLKVWNGAADMWLSNGEMVAIDTPYVVAGNSDANMTIEGAGDGDLYDVTFDVTTYTMTVKKSIETGIENIAAEGASVEYFNLQGIRVENPVNGLYIRRQGNNVAKVLVK